MERYPGEKHDLLRALADIRDAADPSVRRRINNVLSRPNWDVKRLRMLRESVRKKSGPAGPAAG